MQRQARGTAALFVLLGVLGGGSVAIAQDRLSDDAFARLARYELGQDSTFLRDLERAMQRADVDSKRTLETRALEVLQSPRATFAGREYAARMLARVGGEASLPALSSLLGHDELDEPARAALEQLAVPGVDQTLIAALDRLEGGPRRGVVRSLGRRGAQAAEPALARLLEDDEPETVRTAIVGLGQIAGVEATRALIDAPLGPEFAEARHHAILFAAERLRGAGEVSTAVEICRWVARSSDRAAVRVAALRGLARAQPGEVVAVIVTLLKDQDPLVRRAGAQLVARTSDADVIAELADGLRGLPPAGRVTLLESLGVRRGAGGNAVLIDALDDSNALVRHAALSALERRATAVELAPLLERLLRTRDADRAALERAVSSAASRAPPSSRQPLLEAAFQDGTPPSRASIARVLGRLHDATSLATLRGSLDDGDLQVRLASVQALADWPDAEPLEDLFLLARSEEDAELRTAVYRGLAHMLEMPSERSPDATRRLYDQAMSEARAPEERAQVLASVASVHEFWVLDFIEPHRQNEVTATAADAALDRVEGVLAERVPHAAIGRAVQLAVPPAPQYQGGGTNALTDGRAGSLDCRDGLWQGFQADVEAILDLGSVTAIERVRTSFLEDTRSWIFLPRRITIAISEDGSQFRHVAAFETSAPADHRAAHKQGFGVRLEGERARYVRVLAHSLGSCPAWHPGSGTPAWVFADEIRVNPLFARPGPAAWTGWLGPRRNGTSPELGWSAVGRAEPLWSGHVGRGYSAVSVADGWLYTLGFDEEAGRDTVVCLNADTGEERWSHSYPAEILNNMHGGGTLTTPAIDGDVVYTTNRDGRLFKFRADDGEVLWERSLADELGLERPQHGFPGSPIVLGNRLLLNLGGTTVSLDKGSGELIWRSEDYENEGSYSNPCPFELDGRELVAVYNATGLIVLDRASGNELQRYPWELPGQGFRSATPLAVGVRVFVSSAQGGGLFRFDGGTPTPEWAGRQMRSKVNACVPWDGHLYGFDESMLKCVALDGTERWRERGLGMGSLIASDGKLLILSSSGELIVADANPGEYVERSRTKVLDGGVYWTMPVLWDGRVYCRSSLGDLVCLDHRSANAPDHVPVAHSGAPSGAPPEAVDLFVRHGIGSETLGAKTSMRLRGTLEVPGTRASNCDVVVERSVPNRWRLVATFGAAGKIQRGFDGEAGWRIDPVFGNSILEGPALREAAETGALHHDLEFRERYSSMRTVGRKTFAGVDCWVVEAESVGGARRRFFFEVEHGRLAGRDAAGESMLVLADYREFDGVWIATRQTTLHPETGAEEVLRVASVEFDVVPDAAYERPPEARRMLMSRAEVEAINAGLRTQHAALLGAYVAQFEGLGELRFEVLVEDGALALHSERLGTFRLQPPDQEGRWCFASGADVFLQFVAGDDGTITAIRVTREGIVQMIPRVTDG